MKKAFCLMLTLVFVICQLPVLAAQTDKVHVIESETVINAQEYSKTEGTVEDVNDYWADEGSGYISNPNSEVWSASYKLSVSPENEGIYDISVICGHWSTALIELKLYLDGEAAAIVPVSSVNSAADLPIPEISAGSVRLTAGTHTIKVEGISGSNRYYFKQMKFTKLSEGIPLSDGLVINAQEYSETEGTVENVNDYWADEGSGYISNPNSEVWSASYKLSVSPENEGIYDISLICGHWSTALIELKLYLDGEAEAIVPVSSVNSAADLPIPEISAGSVRLTAGTHTIKAEGISGSNRYYFKQMSFQKVDCGTGNEALGISASEPDLSVAGEASIEITKLLDGVDTAVLAAALKNGGRLKDIKMSGIVQLEKGKSVKLTVSGLKTELESGEDYSFYVFKSIDSLTPLAVKMNSGAFLNPSPSEFRGEDDSLNDAYDYITAADGGFKGVYCTADQYAEADEIAGLKSAGVNSFIVYIYEREHMQESAYKELISKWKAAIGDAKLFTVAGFGSDMIYGNSEFGEFVGENGEKINAPCPLSRQYWQKVYGQRAAWSYEAGAAGCLADMEMYGADTTHYTSLCFCDSCWEAFCDYAFCGENRTISAAEDRAAFITDNGYEDAYSDFMENTLIELLSCIRNSVPENFMLGYLLYYEELRGLSKGLGTPTAPALVLDEFTYFSDGSAGYDYKERIYGQIGDIYKNGKPAIMLPGFWPNKYTASGQKTTIDDITSIKNNGKGVDGFWIYCLNSLTHSEAEEGYEKVGCKTGENPADYIKSLAEIKPKNNY